MKVSAVWTIRTFPIEVFHKDFIIFIENKWEFFDPFGEHIYLPLTIWASTNHITPPGEITEDYQLVLDELECSGADMFTILSRKDVITRRLLGKECFRVLQLESRSVNEAFFSFLEDKYEYRGVDGNHLYSLEGVWLQAKEKVTDDIKGQYFELWNLLSETQCDFFDFTDD